MYQRQLTADISDAVLISVDFLSLPITPIVYK